MFAATLQAVIDNSRGTTSTATRRRGMPATHGGRGDTPHPGAAGRIRDAMRVGAVVAVIVLGGCQSGSSARPGGAGGGAVASTGAGGLGAGGEASWQVPAGSGGCDTTLYDPPLDTGGHVEECSKLAHKSNPPTSGAHYGRWADYRYYDKAVPRGYYLHSMEHGGVVVAYRCMMSDCSSIAAPIHAFADALPSDDKCAGAAKPRRIVVTPDPALDVPFAVTAWGHMLKAKCLDATLAAKFIAQHYAKAPEDFCAAGFDPTDPAAGVPPDCGK